MIDARNFVSTPVKSPSGHARTFEETARWVAPLLRRVPITRVADVAPLDYLNLPVFAAITPLARDLTTHAGKGATPAAARLSAIMEAIERVSAEEIPADEAIVRGSFAELSRAGDRKILDPLDLDLPLETTYDPAREYSWVTAFDLSREESLLVPADAVITPGREEIISGVSTNGLASGNSYSEATLHALCEVIERHEMATQTFVDLYGEPDQHALHPVKMIDPQTLPETSRSWARRVEEAGLILRIRDYRGLTDIPVYGAALIDTAYPTADLELTEVEFTGFGCDIDASRAVLRAITEGIQGRAICMQGARDTTEGGAPVGRTLALKRRNASRHPVRLLPFEHNSSSSSDIQADLSSVVARLKVAGLSRVLVARLTQPHLGVPVVRVIVPGLSGSLNSSRQTSLRLLGALL